MKNISGMRYGKLTVGRPDGKGKGGRVRWFCECDCGGSGLYYKNNLDAGRHHCGCEANRAPNLKHGLRHHPLYGIWSAMKTRCGNPDAKDYPAYGGRGIEVCDSWMDLEKFIKDMSPRPSGYSLDRIDVDKGYNPENCRWASAKTQRWNQRKECKVFPNGMTTETLASSQSVDPATIRMRVHRGWSDEEIVKGARDVAKNR